MKRILFSLLCLQIELLASSPEFLSIDEKIQFLASQDLVAHQGRDDYPLRPYLEQILSDPMVVLDWGNGDGAERVLHRNLSPYIKGSIDGETRYELFPFVRWQFTERDYVVFPELALKFRLEFLRRFRDKIENADTDTHFGEFDREIFIYSFGPFQNLLSDTNLWDFPNELVQFYENLESYVETVFLNPSSDRMAEKTSMEEAFTAASTSIKNLGLQSIYREPSVLGGVFPDLLTLHSLLLGELRDRGMEIESEVLSKAHLNVVGFADHMEVTELSSGKRHFIDAFLIESGVLPNGTTLDSYTKSVDFSGQTAEEIKNQLVDLERVILSAIESTRPGEML